MKEAGCINSPGVKLKAVSTRARKQYLLLTSATAFAFQSPVIHFLYFSSKFQILYLFGIRQHGAI